MNGKTVWRTKTSEDRRFITTRHPLPYKMFETYASEFLRGWKEEGKRGLYNIEKTLVAVYR